MILRDANQFMFCALQYRILRRLGEAPWHASQKAKPQTHQLRDEAQLNCVALRPSLDYEKAWRAVKGQDERQKTAPLTALHAGAAATSEEKNKEGRHVGLDLLIEAHPVLIANVWRPRSRSRQLRSLARSGQVGRELGVDAVLCWCRSWCWARCFTPHYGYCGPSALDQVMEACLNTSVIPGLRGEAQSSPPIWHEPHQRAGSSTRDRGPGRGEPGSWAFHRSDALGSHLLSIISDMAELCRRKAHAGSYARRSYSEIALATAELPFRSRPFGQKGRVY